jgi:putative transposase
MSVSYIHNKHSVTGGGFHFQFTPKYRRLVFEDEQIKFCVNNAFKAAANRLGIQIRCIEYGPEHVHLFVTHIKNYSQAKLAGYLKGFTSRMVRRDLWHRVKKYEWGKHFWTPSYFSEPVGHLTDAHIEHYITRQQRKHWKEPRNKSTKEVMITQTTLNDYAKPHPL